MMCGRFAFVVAAAMSATSYGAVLNPVATSGHDGDVVFETGLATGATGANQEIGSRQFFEEGSLSGTEGLPRNLPAFNSTNGNVINYSFQPFEQNNILKFTDTNASTPKTLTLATPSPYAVLAVVMSGGSLVTASEIASVSYKINFAGGGSQTGTVGVPDWGAAPMPAGTEELFNADRTTANATAWPVTSDNNTTAGRWSINVAQIDVTDTVNDILSVEFGPITLNDVDGLLNAGDDVAIWGLAGAVAEVPEPSSVALGLIGALYLAGRRHRR
jgi:hypothetical protein